MSCRQTDPVLSTIFSLHLGAQALLSALFNVMVAPTRKWTAIKGGVKSGRLPCATPNNACQSMLQHSLVLHNCCYNWFSMDGVTLWHELTGQRSLCEQHVHCTENPRSEDTLLLLATDCLKHTTLHMQRPDRHLPRCMSVGALTLWQELAEWRTAPPQTAGTLRIRKRTHCCY